MIACGKETCVKKVWVLVLSGPAGKSEFYADPNKKTVAKMWKKLAPSAKKVTAEIVKKVA
jgi:arabinogalactan endo-1,4-beta-galactosidase